MKLSKSYLIENILVEADAKFLLQEAFGSGQAAKVALKLGNVVNNKIGSRFIFSDVPLSYQNSYGSFAGYLGNDESSGIMLKINFMLSGSDSIESYDVYLDGFDSTPTYTVETSGLNIIQIVNSIAENLVEDGEIDDSVLEENVDSGNDKRLTERGAITNDAELVRVIDLWVKEDRAILKELQKKSVPEIFSEMYSPWVEDKPNYQCAYYLFAKALKMYLLQNGLTNKTLKPRKKGSFERQIVDPVLSAQFDEVVDAISWSEKFDFLKGSIKQMAKGNLNSIIVVGSPGSGKTYTVLDELENAGIEYVRYTGGVKNTEDLIRILWNRRAEEVLVFDDFDAAWKNRDQSNILKAALDNKSVREITYVDVHAGKSMSDVPPKFEFSSFLIFISNSPKIDSAIASRSIVINLTLSNEEMVDKIEKTLKDYRPDVDMKMKREALEYLKEINPGVLSVDYRSMDSLLVCMQISPSNWRKMGLYMIKNVN